jgi:hypothetical protein
MCRSLGLISTEGGGGDDGESVICSGIMTGNYRTYALEDFALFSIKARKVRSEKVVLVQCIANYSTRREM